MLAMSDKNGLVETSLPGLADFARVSLPDCREALTTLESPDPYSRSVEAEGRRIEPVEGGWRLINHRKYRDQMSADQRREYLKLKQREYRQRRKQLSTNVDNVSDKSTLLTHTAPDTDTDTTDQDPLKGIDNQKGIFSSVGQNHDFSSSEDGRPDSLTPHQRASVESMRRPYQKRKAQS